MQRAYYVMRRAVFADALGPSAPMIVAAQPGISFVGLAPHAAGITPFGLEMDRAAEGARPDGGTSTSGLAWGVASVYGERLAIAAPTMMAAHDNLDTLPFDDLIEMFYIARHTGNRPAIVRSSADVAGLSASADAKARLDARLTGGATAVVPSAQVSYGGANDDGWWIVAPDGTVTDEMQSGMHQTLIEYGTVALRAQLVAYAKKVLNSIKQMTAYERNGFIARCVGITAASIFLAAGARGGEEGFEFGVKAAEEIHAIYEANEQKEMLEAAEECAAE